MGFLPDDYKEPTTSNYMKFQEGDNTIRILSESITGYEIWEETKNNVGEISRKPLRFRKEDEIPMEKVGTDKFGNTDLKFFWAFVVYNWIEDRIQILEITQKTIREQILNKVRNKSWGDPKEYNLVITKTKKENGMPKYEVDPEPKEELPKEILDKYKGMKINLEALYDGEDPFEASKSKDEDIEIDNDEIAKEVN